MTMPPRRAALAALLAVLLPLAACDSAEQQEAFYDEANRTPAGIARTDEDGRIVEDDPDDWRTAPAYGGIVRFEPAYPNPAASGALVALPVSILQFGAVQGGLYLRTYVQTSQGPSLRLLDRIPDASDPGGYDFRFTPAAFGLQGLQRVYVFDGAGELVTYGDVRIQ